MQKWISLRETDRAVQWYGEGSIAEENPLLRQDFPQCGLLCGLAGGKGARGLMYFASRVQAGRMLASQLVPKYQHQKCAVVALTNGGVVVGAQIAMQLHCVLTMLMTEEIELPHEIEAVAGIAQDGSFSYNEYYAPSEIDELVSEYHGFLDQERFNKLSRMHERLRRGGLIRPDLLHGANIILVSDGFKTGFQLDIAMQFLKPVALKKLIIAAPLASVHAVDRMHVLADELYCLSVLTDYFTTDHYYDTQDVPDEDTIIETVENIVKQWRQDV